VISKAASKHHIGVEPGFQWRGDEITRVEGLSDAVFAFAVTLLVVSLEVPKTFDEFYLTIAGLPSFAMTFMLLMFIWFEQYKYFRRYGLQDMKTVVLTLTLLFIVLYYMYPMKFLFNGIFGPIIHSMFPSIRGVQAELLGSIDDVANLMIMYNIGVLAVWGIFYLMYRHALLKKDLLELNHVEIYYTRSSMRDCIFFIILGTVGLIMAMTHNNIFVSLSGIMYGPVCATYFTIAGNIGDKKRKKLMAELEQHKALQPA
jgi:uncharacterized membrane protein